MHDFETVGIPAASVRQKLDSGSAADKVIPVNLPLERQRSISSSRKRNHFLASWMINDRFIGIWRKNATYLVTNIDLDR